MFLDNLKPLTFTFFKFKVPNFKQFFYGTLHCIGTGNMSESYWEAKAVLDNVKISAWSYFKFWVSGEEIDKSYVHCICVRCFEKIGEYSAAACARSGAFLVQVITTIWWWSPELKIHIFQSFLGKLCILLGFQELSQIFPLLLSLCSTFAYLPHNPRHCPPVHLWFHQGSLEQYILCLYLHSSKYKKFLENLFEFFSKSLCETHENSCMFMIQKYTWDFH